MDDKKVCTQCKSTESKEWHELEVEVEDPISIDCSDCEPNYIVDTVALCDTCMAEFEFQQDGPWNYE